jgi:hypothetical protein
MYPTESDSIPASRALSIRATDYLESKNVPRLFQRMTSNTINFFVDIVRFFVYKFRYWVLGQRGVYKVIGPGEIYLKI